MTARPSRFVETSRVRLAASAVALSALSIGAVVVTMQAISIDRVEAVWGIDGEVGDSSLAIPIRAAHPSCPSWSTLGGLVVDAVETEDSVTIVATFPDHEERSCEWMGTAMPSSVRLEQPLGDRVVIDGATGLEPATPAALAFRTGQTPASVTPGDR